LKIHGSNTNKAKSVRTFTHDENFQRDGKLSYVIMRISSRNLKKKCKLMGGFNYEVQFL